MGMGIRLTQRKPAGIQVFINMLQFLRKTRFKYIPLLSQYATQLEDQLRERTGPISIPMNRNMALSLRDLSRYPVGTKLQGFLILQLFSLYCTMTRSG